MAGGKPMTGGKPMVGGKWVIGSRRDGWNARSPLELCRRGGEILITSYIIIIHVNTTSAIKTY